MLKAKQLAFSIQGTLKCPFSYASKQILVTFYAQKNLIMHQVSVKTPDLLDLCDGGG